MVVISSKVATNQKVGGSNPSGATIVNPVAMQSSNCIAIFIFNQSERAFYHGLIY